LPVAALAVALAATSCSTLVDENRARICRTAVPAIEPADATIRILRTRIGGPPNSVRVDYELSEGGAIPALRHVLCRFGGDEGTAHAQTLTGLETPTGPLDGVKLYFLRRFYLEANGAPPPDPDALGMRSAASVPPGLALALQQGIAALPSAAIYGLLASSYALIHGLVGRVVFGFGELAILGGYATLTGLALALGGGPAAALLIGLALALGVSAAYGAAAGRFVVLPTLSAKGQAVVIATIGLMLALNEYARLTQPTVLKWAPPLLSSPIGLARAGDFIVTVTPMQLVSVAAGLAGALCLLGFQRWSAFGRRWRAVAQDPLAAALFGVSRDEVVAKSFALAAALAGLAGFVLTLHFGQAGYAFGLPLALKALVGAVLGGIGSVGAAFVGGVALAFCESAWSALFTIDSRDLAVYSLLAVLFVFRPYGVFGRRPDAPSLD
jgi:branched-subunit amino acid ABC-type transport system permease component